MHGLMLKSFEAFVHETYGAALWTGTLLDLDAGIERFEPMFHYDDALATRLVGLVAERLDKPRDVLLEDFGTFLVTNPRSQRVRRLLRFGGVDYVDFLLSLEDLAGRARLAVPDLVLPQIELEERGEGEYVVVCQPGPEGYDHVVLGLLRAMADDYGALVFIDSVPTAKGAPACLIIRLLQTDFAAGRGFALAEGATG